VIEFILIDHPVQFPQACIGCMSQKGPMIDTHRQLRSYGQIYICHVCAKTTARLLGFAPGERLDVLSQASERLVELDREIASLTEQLSDTTTAFEAERVQTRVLRDKMKDLNGHIARLETEIRSAAEHTLAAVSS